eukprot:14173993-Alexandrium_andersonii.AAC.1
MASACCVLHVAACACRPDSRALLDTAHSARAPQDHVTCCVRLHAGCWRFCFVLLQVANPVR